MPKPSPKAVNEKRFAALFAGFDVGNGSEEEALSKGRAMRRMAVESNQRIIDLLEMEDIRRAIDVQMQPARKDSRELQEAMEQATAAREQLIERTRDVRKLADMLTQQKQVTERLREELAAVKYAGNHGQARASQPSQVAAPASVSQGVPRRSGSQSAVIQFVALWLVLALMLLAAIH